MKRYVKVILPAVVFVVLLASVIFYVVFQTQETTTLRDLVIDLGDGLTTDAQLTFPAVGEPPFPGVLLIQGSGPRDMNEYIPPEDGGYPGGSRPQLQIAQYLSERGFAVLRYNKRGVGLNGVLLNQDIYLSITFQDLKKDAEKALEVLMQQPGVDANEITLIGHSEGTLIAPRIAIENPKVKNIVLLGPAAQNLRDLLYFQIVERRITYAEDVLDIDHDGLLSIDEVAATIEVSNIDASPLPPKVLLQNGTAWNLGLDTDGDGFLSIQDELQPLFIREAEFFASEEFPLSNWVQSHLALDTNLAAIGNVSASILILHGEGDTRSPVEQAHLLKQRLTEINHPDHTLITYPGLGHTFYPADGWIQPEGPIQDYVLSDLADWLKDRAGNASSPQ